VPHTSLAIEDAQDAIPLTVAVPTERVRALADDF
jgi:hypothetical protein